MNFYQPDTNNLFVISDTHAFHKNICSGVTSWEGDLSRCRDFPDEVVMTEHIAQKINEKVGANDTLMHLGDWSFGGKDKIQRFRDMINCKNIILLLGNHDKHIEKNPEEFAGVFSRVMKYNEFRYRKILVSCFHFPIGSWNEIGRGGWMLHGHCHNSYQVPGKILDVGLDNERSWTSLGYSGYPLHIEEIYQIMQEKEVQLVDHHGAKTNYG